jgi:hypothetical protein
LARDRLMETAAREAAVEHAAGCPRCEARLAAEQDLTANLRLLAGAAGSGAPGPTEAVLREAFRATSGRRRLVVRLWPFWAAAAAAAVVAAILLAPWRPADRPKGLAGSVAKSEQPAGPEPPPVQARETAGPPVAVIRKPARPTPLPASASAPQAAEEVMTGFLPVGYGAGLRPLESISIVRVSLPRWTLISFGLPVNMERAAEPLEADVVFAEDGTARAIRFIR